MFSLPRCHLILPVLLFLLSTTWRRTHQFLQTQGTILRIKVKLILLHKQWPASNGGENGPPAIAEARAATRNPWYPRLAPPSSTTACPAPRLFPTAKADGGPRLFIFEVKPCFICRQFYVLSYNIMFNYGR